MMNMMRRAMLMAALCAGLFVKDAQAQLPKSPSAQIFLDGILQAATLDPTCKASKFCGGTMTVNGELVTVPKNMMVMFPANALTWQEIFTNPAAATPITGFALADPPSPAGATYHVSVAANQVGNLIIAALIDMTQTPLMSGSGYIDGINYGTTGELSVAINGGAGAKVRINDPTGRYGIVQTGGAFDARFCVDPDNPTIHATTGFPMCIPRTDPATAVDPLCPDTINQRPLDGAGNPATIIQMNTPGNNPDPLKMVPFKVGDYITFAGVLTSAGFIAAYEIINNVAIYTAAGVDPAFTVFETALIGTGGLNVLGAGEAAVRSRFEGFTTDPTRPVQLWALDFSPLDGSFTKRDLGQVMPDPGPPKGAAMGRWRFRPPCTTTGPLAVGSPYLGNKGCTPPPGGVYTPPTREVMADIVGCTPVKGAVNGITSGTGPGAGCMYRNPTIEYIWPENIPGTPIAESNFQAVPFLTQGGYTSGAGTLVSTLNPWPSNNLPADSCLPPTITVGGPYSVTTGGAVTVSATVTGPGAPYTFAWAADVPANGGTSPTPNQLSASFNPVAADTTYTITVTNVCSNKFTAKATVTVLAGAKQAILAIAPLTVKSGTTDVAITASLSAAAPATDSFTWAFPAAITKKTQTANPTHDSVVTFDAPVIPLGTVTPTVLSFSVFAGAGATQSDVVGASVTVSPPSDTVTITSIAFRCDKHRMTVTATSSIVNAGITMKLLNYVDNNGAPYNTATLGNTFTNGGGGIYTITIEPVPLPSTTSASLAVRSSLGGSDAKKVVIATDVKNGLCTI